MWCFIPLNQCHIFPYAIVDVKRKEKKVKKKIAAASENIQYIKKKSGCLNNAKQHVWFCVFSCFCVLWVLKWCIVDVVFLSSLQFCACDSDEAGPMPWSPASGFVAVMPGTVDCRFGSLRHSVLWDLWGWIHYHWSSSLKDRQLNIAVLHFIRPVI